ncbi:hypothetical protein Q1W73_12265 [Asticcacaulis sp. ZE23SCel15]|uniref:hypothetical protein n=1 Tax=Asticcacaulis sp. ZE23SCel15 TaxID=3059027 RepID=UPI00265F25C4|nr:hypothetical protein [Asticcacaulis sp. ZE23SCel15]WKL56461.1 hypothetical protein Q1W73_12265 [Asticcacaulis sp. ZE23SCel15]
MTDNDRLIQQAERLGHLRRLFLIGQAVGYIGWIGSSGLEYVRAPLIDPFILKFVQNMCWPLWLVSLLATLLLMRRTAIDRQLGALLDDERTSGLIKSVFQTSYWVLLIAVALVYAATFVAEVDIRAIAPVLLSIGVAVPSLTYACLYRG